MQSRGNGVKRGNQSTLPETAKTLSAGDISFGSLLFMGKNLPSPRFKMNMFMDYDEYSGKIKVSDSVRETLVELSGMLQGMSSNTKIIHAELDVGSIQDNDI